MKEYLQPAFDFLEGKINETELMRQADESFFKSLQALVPNGTTRCIQEIKNGELLVKTVPYAVKAILSDLYDKGTLDAKVNFFAEIRDLLTPVYPDLSVDDSIIKKFRFILRYTPSYIDGVEAQKVLVDVYDQLDDKEPKAYRKRIKELFPYAHKPPTWLQAPEWPIDPKGFPMEFLHSTRDKKRGVTEYFFRQIDSEDIISVKQTT